MISRLTTIEKRQMNNLLDSGMSLNVISEHMKKSKSTIYYYYEKKYGKRTKNITFNFTDEELGEFLGIFTGDGNFYFDWQTHKYKIRIFTGVVDTHYHESLQKFFTKIFDKCPQSYSIPKDHVLVTQYYSKQIYLLLKEHLFWKDAKTNSIMLKNQQLRSQEFIIGFLRGLFDTDGNFYRPKKRIVFATASLELANQIKMFLDAQGFPHSFYKNSGVYRLDLYGKYALQLLDLIKPRNVNKTVVV